MSVKDTIIQQYQALVDRAAERMAYINMPQEGWLRTVRKALHMSGAQLARRMGVSRARVADAEHSELEGAITIKSMQTAAEAMGCKFVYAIVPRDNVSELIMEQARRKASAIVGTASGHMALENQALPHKSNLQEVLRLSHQLASKMPPDFWDDK